ncbi:MAG: hypothetical protein V4639_00265 [Pseudomonadota bacterium]|nr:hypothetical protein [Polaromonas sp.]
MSEAISEDALVELFSPVIVEHSRVMFEPGNVIVRGLQGTGKTMLLNLLRPDSRLAYARARIPFPVPTHASRFVGAGINLRKCGALEFAQHLEKEATSREIQELQLLFADFVNCWIVIDLIASIQRLISEGTEELLKEIGVSDNKGYLDSFAKTLAADPCWFGALDGIENLDQLSAKLSWRIAQYRRYLNLNSPMLPAEITESKTVIGDPILKAAEALRSSHVLKPDTKIFVRIDQYEQLTTLNVVGTRYGTGCQELIHKALAARDGRVSYRIGTRTHGWPSPPAIYRTDDVLELKRDFDVIDMDEIFRRRENSRTWVFPKFARDIFLRRLKGSEYGRGKTLADLTIASALGQSLKPSERAARYVSTADGRAGIIDRAIKSLPEAVGVEWKNFIAKVAQTDLLEAWLCCAWIRQKSVVRRGVRPLGRPPKDGVWPWSKQPYWYKERVQHALMQIASANRQALMWSGEDDVLSLSGGQILVFLFVLQHMWDAWLRDQRGLDDGEFNFPIEGDVQSQGVLEASIEWRSKQIEGSNARQRKAFVDALGEHFYVSLIEDKSMSYPGANGFSIANSEFDKRPDLNSFLCESASFGDLYSTSHTSKKKGEKRTKYYLAPILSPYFRIPTVKTKEPEYLNSIEQIQEWIEGPKRKVLPKLNDQPGLWSEHGE